MVSTQTNQPLYAQIADELRLNIQTEKWPEGERIPTEMALCDIYHVSRITIRKAINELVSENLLDRQRAKGTFVKKMVADDSDFATVIKGFTQELKEQGKRATTLEATLTKSHADHKIAKYLKIQPGDDILILERIRGDGSNRLAYFKTHFIYLPTYSMKSSDYYGSFYEYLKTKDIRVDKQSEYIEAIVANRSLQKLLKVSEGDPLLKRVRFTSQASRDFYEYTECYYIGNKYRYYLDFD